MQQMSTRRRLTDNGVFLHHNKEMIFAPPATPVFADSDLPKTLIDRDFIVPHYHLHRWRMVTVTSVTALNLRIRAE